VASKKRDSSQSPGPSPGEAAPVSAPESEEQEKVERDLVDLLADVERERDEYLELARRTKADFENYRRRVAGEASQAEKRGRAGLAQGLIPVIDNLERALAAMESHDQDASEHLAEGVRLVSDELAAVLKRSGVESFEPAGEQFDPHEHEAMMTRPAGSDGAGKVLEVLEKGYRLDGQVLRPARVIVGADTADDGGNE
jgi:molecular chaperone GrpE